MLLRSLFIYKRKWGDINLSKNCLSPIELTKNMYPIIKNEPQIEARDIPEIDLIYDGYILGSDYIPGWNELSNWEKLKLRQMQFAESKELWDTLSSDNQELRRKEWKMPFSEKLKNYRKEIDEVGYDKAKFEHTEVPVPTDSIPDAIANAVHYIELIKQGEADGTMVCPVKQPSDCSAVHNKRKKQTIN